MSAFNQLEIGASLSQLSQGWQVLSSPDRLAKSWPTKNFRDCFEKAQKVYLLAEQMNHHPELKLSFRVFSLEITTYEVNGLQETDFIFAAKVDKILYDA